MKRLFTLCLAMTLAIGTVMADKTVKDVTFEDGELKGVTKTGKTTVMKIVDIKKGEGHKKGLLLDGGIYFAQSSKTPGIKMKLVLDAKKTKGEKPIVIFINQKDIETKKSTVIKRVMIEKSSDFKQTIVEVESIYAGSPVMFNISTGDGEFIIDNYSLTLLD